MQEELKELADKFYETQTELTSSCSTETLRTLLWRAVIKTGKEEIKRRKIIRSRNSSVKTLDSTSNAKSRNKGKEDY